MHGRKILGQRLKRYCSASHVCNGPIADQKSVANFTAASCHERARAPQQIVSYSITSSARPSSVSARGDPGVPANDYSIAWSALKVIARRLLREKRSGPSGFYGPISYRTHKNRPASSVPTVSGRLCAPAWVLPGAFQACKVWRLTFERREAFFESLTWPNVPPASSSLIFSRSRSVTSRRNREFSSWSSAIRSPPLRIR